MSKLSSNVDVEELNKLVDCYNELLGVMRAWQPIIQAVVEATSNKTKVFLLPRVDNVPFAEYVEEVPGYWMSRDQNDD